MFWNLAGKIIGVAVGTYGVLCLVRDAFNFFFPLPSLRVAVEIHGKEETESLDLYLQEAVFVLPSRSLPPLVLFYAETFGEELSEEAEEILEQYGAEAIFLKDEEKEVKNRDGTG